MGAGPWVAFPAPLASCGGAKSGHPFPATPFPAMIAGKMGVAMNLTLKAGDPKKDQLEQGRIGLRLGGEELYIDLTAPAGKVTVEQLLPIVQGLASHLAGRAEADSAAAGKPVTCAKGCGACCRQLVPISQAEARALGRLVDAMPEPRRTEIHRRFDAAVAALDDAGMMPRIAERRASPGTTSGDLGLAYFALGIPCPFLEDEACSIHPDRPTICRQFLVHSDPVHCADPASHKVEGVPLAARPFAALLSLDAQDSGVSWMPLTYALGYHDNLPEVEAHRTAPEILQEFFTRLRDPGGNAA